MVAAQAVSTYVGNLEAGRYEKAWHQLSVESQQQSGSLDAFTAERSAFFITAGKRFKVSDPDNSEAALTQWLPQGFDGQSEHAYVVTVNYPKLAGNNAGFEVFVVAPDGDGVWLIWVVR